MPADEVPIRDRRGLGVETRTQSRYRDRTSNLSGRSSIMRSYWAGIAAASALAFCGTLNAAQAPTPTPNLPQAPEVYKYVPGWPKPLPNGWSMGTVTGMYVDK